MNFLLEITKEDYGSSIIATKGFAETLLFGAQMLLIGMLTVFSVLIIIWIALVIFKFFYMFVGSVFHYIPNDVIPPQFLTRYYGVISIINSGVTAGYNYFFFEYSLSHFSTLLWGTVIFYTVAMGFMCFALKEPRFPEPTTEEKRSSKGLRGVLTFMKESFSHPIYWYEFAKTACTSIVGLALPLA